MTPMCTLARRCRARIVGSRFGAGAAILSLLGPHNELATREKYRRASI